MNSIALHVEESAGATLGVSDDSLGLKVGGKFYAILPPSYQGSYEITPTSETQVLHMVGMTASSDLVIEPIPSNYGLITWDGSVITVS